MTTLVELRILPPFAIGRLGSSAEPMDNYEVNVATPIGWRKSLMRLHSLWMLRPLKFMQRRDLLL